MPATTKTGISFFASFEDVAKVEAAARAEGWKEGDSYADFVEMLDADYRSGRSFDDRAAAVAWLQDQINANRTLFGCGDVIEGEHVQRRDRCRYCVCNGWRRISRAVIDDEGVAEESAEDSDCHN